MTKHSPSPLPPAGKLEAHWLAELVRRHEQREGRLDDRELLPQVLAAAPRLAERILKRAELIGAREGWREAIRAWRAGGRGLLVALAVLAAIGGFGTAAGVLGRGAGPVNVVWALGGLLGIHFLSLLLWLAGTLAAGGGAGGGGAALGRAWLWLTGKLPGARRQLALGPALAAVLARGDLLRWGLGAVSHALWCAALAGALGGLLLLLSIRRYGFVWETTILPVGALDAFVGALGWLPARLGFAIPDAVTVHASGLGLVDTEAARRSWSSWLVGCVLVYGLLPRLALGLACGTWWWRRCRRLTLDLALPGYAELGARLLPQSERLGVCDAAPPDLAGAHVRPLAAGTGEAAQLVGIELGEDPAWPPALPVGVGFAGRVDSREERRRVLDAFAAHPPRRLLVACDARLSPDRGTLALVAALASRAEAARVWLLGATADAARRGYWHEGLASIGLPVGAVMEEGEAALRWLERGE